jgi:hypothetical protein
MGEKKNMELDDIAKILVIDPEALRKMLEDFRNAAD